ncbi:MAG: ribonuclease H-like domain-containing protein [Chloroherpetonaceae bacterium]|nr:ribonuclease H-like domain-containing protein [Chloroherpetonaceae bacterium]MDW8438598.1 DNA polymerase domain-containing protein [Chloroherpetonaceae bacterium]
MNAQTTQLAVEREENLAAKFLQNDLLYGKDPETHLVAAHQISDTHVRLYSRRGDLVTWRDEPFYPFFFISNAGFLRGFQSPPNYWLKELQGNNYYKHLAIFKSWKDFRAAQDYVADMKRKLNQKEAYAVEDEDFGGKRIEEIYAKNDAVSQYLYQTGKTFFKGMTFGDLRRMQLDIETYYDKEAQLFSRSDLGREKIIIIALRDNTGWEEVLHLRQFPDESERAMLQKLIEIIQTRDPDVIEGHNIFDFDLPFIQRRCELYGIRFAIGRDGSLPRSYPASIRFAERTRDYLYCEIAGRHVIDTLLLVQSFDAAKRAMPSYNLKEVAKYFGFARDNRAYIDHADIAEAWDKDPEKLLAYALDDVRETEKLAAMLSGSNFYMTQMMPFSYAQVSRMGPAAKIEALFVREYLRQKHSIPRPQVGQQNVGGFTEVFLKGILGPIVYADVESLYPSIMLTFDIRPASDERKLFPKILADLKALRLEAKARMKSATSPTERDAYDAMQNSFKILINAMYGYLGFRAGIFNDYEQADKVTTTGQEIAKKMIREFEARQCRIVEVDTDGILLIPPPHVQTEEAEKALVKAVSATMPEGISIAYDGRFKKMISYMKKNYVLLGYDGKMKIKGSSLVSRSGEKFGRDFVKKGFECLLNEDISELHKLYIHYRSRILNREMDVSEFSRTESLKSTIEEYKRDVKEGKRAKAITYELVIKSKLPITKGDRITYYVTGSGLQGNFYDKGKLATEWNPDKPDQNVDFYLKRLDEFCEKFKPFFKPSDYSRIFSADELFGFSPDGIEIIKEIQHRDTSEIEEEVPF